MQRSRPCTWEKLSITNLALHESAELIPPLHHPGPFDAIEGIET